MTTANAPAAPDMSCRPNTFTAASTAPPAVALTTSTDSAASTSSLTDSMIGPAPAPTGTPITCAIVAPGSYVTFSDTDSCKRASLPVAPAPATHVVGGKTVTAGAPAVDHLPPASAAPIVGAASAAPVYTFVNARQARARSRAAAVPRLKQLLAARIGPVMAKGEDLEVRIPNSELPATAFLPIERSARPHTILSKLLEDELYVVGRSDCGTCTLISWADAEEDENALEPMDDYVVIESPMEEVN